MIIIPDVHGRDFWKKAVEGHENEPIIFLGDYLDPYFQEWKNNPITEDFDMSTHIKKVQEIAIANFKEIIEFKKSHMSNVTLLIGNHDCSYAVSSYICSCRRDGFNADKIMNLFTSNWELFQLAYIYNYKGRDIIFTHAGVHKTWFLSHWGPDSDIVTSLNKLWREGSMRDRERALSDVSALRGGWSSSVGSCVWADVREWNKSYEPIPYYQIFGHTILPDLHYTAYVEDYNTPTPKSTKDHMVITDNFACVDIRRATTLDEIFEELEKNS